MDKINWDNAPERPTNDHDKQVEMNINDTVTVRDWNDPKLDRVLDGPIKEAPKEWDGEGLPPVGTVCLIMRNLREVPVEVIMYRGDSVVIEYFCSKNLEVCSCDVVSFIPQDKRTDKDRAIDEMISDSGGIGGFINKPCAINYLGELYDAGYRKENDNG